MTHTVIIDQAGTLEFVYDDALARVCWLGPTTLRRASHVEPHPDMTAWVADLSPVGGPTLGPFPLRDWALSAERRYLEEHLAKK